MEEMEQLTDYQKATLESVWAAFRETDRLIKANAAELERQIKEWKEGREKEWKQREEEREKERKQREVAAAESERRSKKIDEQLGAWANSQGAFAEDYFFNSFEYGKKTFFGEKFDRIEKNVKSLDYVIKDEYDIVMVNGKSVAIIEVKYKAHEHNIPQVIRKAQSFKANYPQYAHHKIFLCLASLSFYPVVEQECKNNGIAIVKLVGDVVVVNDACLKTY